MRYLTIKGADINSEIMRFAIDIASRGGTDVVIEWLLKTNLPNVYGGGDAVTGPNLAVKAIMTGGSAAKNMSKELGFPDKYIIQEFFNLA